MPTLWITGAAGAVGSRLVKKAAQQGDFDTICAFTHSASPIPSSPDISVTWMTLDIGDPAAVLAAAERMPPAVIINPAAMTNVDACETRQEEAQRANSAGPRYLAEAAVVHRSHLIHVSTDYVFPGDDAQPGPYRENDAPRAISYYGQTKLDGEKAIIATCADEAPYAIVRTALVVGPGARSNFVTWLARELQAGRRVRIVRDQYNTPTLADDLADVLLWLAAKHSTGLYHAAGKDRLGRHEWAQAIVAHFGLDASLIDWVTTAELHQPAPRPLQSGLLCERLAAEGAPLPRGILQGLAELDWG